MKIEGSKVVNPINRTKLTSLIPAENLICGGLRNLRAMVFFRFCSVMWSVVGNNAHFISRKRIGKIIASTLSKTDRKTAFLTCIKDIDLVGIEFFSFIFTLLIDCHSLCGHLPVEVWHLQNFCRWYSYPI
ncbi:MAG: hypothetical protein R6V49_04335 [Bacteroidales bacterium]